MELYTQAVILLRKKSKTGNIKNGFLYAMLTESEKRRLTNDEAKEVLRLLKEGKANGG